VNFDRLAKCSTSSSLCQKVFGIKTLVTDNQICGCNGLMMRKKPQILVTLFKGFLNYMSGLQGITYVCIPYSNANAKQ